VVDYEDALWLHMSALVSETLDILNPTTPEHREHVRRLSRDAEITAAELKAGLRPGATCLGVVTEPIEPSVRFVRVGR
jgi:hypothetical protein